MISRALVIVLAAIIIIPLISALQLPKNIIKIQEANQEAAEEFLQNASIFVAFLAGMTSLFSPCILPILPAYFAITFKQKKRITLATLAFFVGFALVFVIMGVVAAITGSAISSVFQGQKWIIPLAGVIFLALGIMTFIGKSFSGFLINKRFEDDTLGVFLSGAVFAIGWSACTGPLLAGVLVMTTAFHNYTTAALLMLSYSLGIFVPLFVLSFFYDKVKPRRLNWLNKEITFGRFSTSPSKMISGSLFVILGLAFIIFGGTAPVNGFNMFGLRENFYSLQRAALGSASTVKYIGAVALFVFVLVLGYYLYRDIKAERGKDK